MTTIRAISLATQRCFLFFPPPLVLITHSAGRQQMIFAARPHAAKSSSRASADSLQLFPLLASPLNVVLLLVT